MTGLPGGQEIAQKLCARAWISAHDGEKEVKGVATFQTVVHKNGRDEVESVVSPTSDKFPSRKLDTKVLALKSGEETTLNGLMDFWLDDSSDD